MTEPTPRNFSGVFWWHEGASRQDTFIETLKKSLGLAYKNVTGRVRAVPYRYKPRSVIRKEEKLCDKDIDC